jgi:hypothetical protein
VRARAKVKSVLSNTSDADKRAPEAEAWTDRTGDDASRDDFAHGAAPTAPVRLARGHGDTESARAPRVFGATTGLTIRLDRNELRRLDEEVAASGQPRGQWILSLIRERLHATPQLNRVDRAYVASIARDMRKIEAGLSRTMNALAETKAPLRSPAAALASIERFRGQIARLTLALDDVFQRNRGYWAAAVGEAKRDAPALALVEPPVRAPAETDEGAIEDVDPSQTEPRRV